jgi:hypothetical protein
MITLWFVMRYAMRFGMNTEWRFAGRRMIGTLH